MKSLRALAIVALFLAGSVPAWGADEFIIDPVHSSIEFSVRHMMVTNVRGRFREFSGTILYDEKDITKSSVRVTIKTASIDTGNADRDNHLRSPDFFDAAKYPEITFTSTRIAWSNPSRSTRTKGSLVQGCPSTGTTSVWPERTIPPSRSGPSAAKRFALRPASSQVRRIRAPSGSSRPRTYPMSSRLDSRLTVGNETSARRISTAEARCGEAVLMVARAKAPSIGSARAAVKPAESR
ncbi:MAG: YceI family protein [Dehalococcoidia bacterium]|nr:YceI family protein [Dehalococcoidia bacterium]